MKTQSEIKKLVEEALRIPYENTVQYNIEVLNDVLDFLENTFATPKPKFTLNDKLIYGWCAKKRGFHPKARYYNYDTGEILYNEQAEDLEDELLSEEILTLYKRGEK